MTRPYSEDLRERALLMAERGETIRSIGAALSISPSCVSKWRKLQRETGALKPGRVGGHKKRVLSGEVARGCASASGLAPSPCRSWRTSWTPAITVSWRLAFEVGRGLPRHEAPETAVLGLWLSARGWSERGFPDRRQTHAEARAPSWKISRSKL